MYSFRCHHSKFRKTQKIFFCFYPLIFFLPIKSQEKRRAGKHSLGHLKCTGGQLFAKWREYRQNRPKTRKNRIMSAVAGTTVGEMWPTSKKRTECYTSITASSSQLCMVTSVSDYTLSYTRNSEFLCVAYEARADVSRTMAMRDKWRTATHCILREKEAR